MTVAPNYVDIEDVKRSLSQTGTTYLDDDIERAAAAVSEGIDLDMHRTFMPASTDVGDVETRYFLASDSRQLAIDDITTVTAVAADRDADGTYEQAWQTTDWFLSPLNATVYRRPYTTLMARGTSPAFPTGTGTYVSVTGLYGWPEPPPGIVEYAQILTTKLLIRKRQAPLGFVVTPEAAIRLARNDPDYGPLVEQFSRAPLLF